MDVEQNLVNVADPETGQIGSIPASQLSEALGQGFTQPEQKEVDAYIFKQEHSTPAQQAIGFGEQALSAATLHGSDVAATKLGLTTPEAREARKEALGVPGTMIAQGAGLLAGSALLPGEGALGLLGKAGEGAAEAVGLGQAASTAAKIGSAAVKGAAENAAYQATDEAAKLLQNEHESFGQVAANIGMAAAIGAPIGGALGSVSPLWEAASATRLGQSLKSITDKFGGIEGSAASATRDVADRAGINLSPEAKAVIAKDQALNDLAQPLLDSQTGSGKDFQAAIAKTRSDLTGAVLESVGKAPQDIEALSDFSAHKAGTELQNNLVSKIKEIYEPIQKTYAEIADKYKTAEFNAGDRAVLQENFAQKALDAGWSVRPSSPEAGFINRAIKDIGVIDNLDKLRNFGSSLSKEAVSMNRFDISRSVGDLFDSAEDAFVKLRLSGEAPELLGKHEAVTAQYKEMKGIINELNARLHAGSSKGVGTFLYKLQDMVPEQLLNRLAQTKDAGFTEFLGKHFPDVQSAVNDFQLNKLLKASQAKMGSEEVLNPAKFFKQVQNLSPELRDALIPKEGQARLGAISELWEGLHRLPENYSKTAGVLTKSLDKMGAALGAVASLVMGHNPITGALEGHLAQTLGRTVPDAVRLAMIKFLGSNKEISAPAFKAMVQFIDHAIKGENALVKATKNVFKAGQIVVPSAAMPTQKDRDRLDKVLKAYQQSPDSMLGIGGHTGHYLPGHASAQAQRAAEVVQAVNQMRPQTVKANPLDKEIEPTKAEKAEFDRVLDFTEKPIIALQHIKDGTLLPKDVAVIAATNPEWYHRTIDKLTAEMTDHLSKGGTIPYKTRMGLSLFAGHPLDSTMTPEGLQNTQASFMMAPTPSQQQQGPQSPKHSMTALNKMAMADATPSQSRERQKALK